MFLGVSVDSKLNWKKYVPMLNSKLNRLIGILFKVRHNITSESLRQIYLSLAYDSLINDIFYYTKEVSMCYYLQPPICSY